MKNKMKKILIIGAFIVAFLLLSIPCTVAASEKATRANDITEKPLLAFSESLTNYPITGGWLLALIAFLFRLLFGIYFPF